MANGYHAGHLRDGAFPSLQTVLSDSAVSECASFFKFFLFFYLLNIFIKFIGVTVVSNIA